MSSIPTESEFRETIKSLAKPPSVDFLTEESFNPDNKAKTIELLEQALIDTKKNFISSLELPAGKSLTNDRMFERAHKALLRQTVKREHNDFAESMFHHLGEQRFDLHEKATLAIDKATRYEGGWLLSVMQSLYEYHFDNKAAISSKTKIAELERLKSQAEQGAKALMEIEKIGLSSIHSNSRIKVIEDNYRRTIHRIERHLRFAQDTLIPINRNDSTAKERLLIYRLWHAHTGLFRRPHIRTIQYLLLIDGVNAEINERNVEKMCATFRERYGRYTHGYIRHLYKQIRDKYYRAN